MLEGKKTRLVLLEEHHLEDIMRGWNNPEMRKLFGVFFPHTKEAESEWIQSTQQQTLKSESIAHSIHLKVQELSGVLSIFGIIPRTNFLAVRPMLAKGFFDYDLIPIV